MRRLLIRTGGLALVVAGAAGLIFIIAALVVVMRVREQATTGILARIDVADRALSATAQGLSVVDTSLTNAQATLGAIQLTTLGLAQAIGDNKPLVESLATLTGEDLPNSITATQQSLSRVEDSARVVDDTLAALNSVPFLGQLVYAPEESLSESLGNLNESLDSLWVTFRDVRTNLETTADNLDRVQSDIETVGENLGAIDDSLGDAEGVVDNYEQVVASLQTDLRTLRDRLPDWLNLGVAVIALILIWLGIAQIGLFSQGLELITRSRAIQPATRPDLSATLTETAQTSEVSETSEV
jgi:hypothetical protein